MAWQPVAIANEEARRGVAKDGTQSQMATAQKLSTPRVLGARTSSVCSNSPSDTATRPGVPSDR